MFLQRWRLKLTKRKTPTKQAPQDSTEAVESFKQESNTKVAQATTTAKKASTGGRRGRPKKTVVEPKVEINIPAPVSKVIDVDSRTITYVYPSVLTKHVVTDYGVAPQPSKYEQFKAWLVFKLYHYTSYFRGY